MPNCTSTFPAARLLAALKCEQSDPSLPNFHRLCDLKVLSQQAQSLSTGDGYFGDGTAVFPESEDNFTFQQVVNMTTALMTHTKLGLKFEPVQVPDAGRGKPISYIQEDVDTYVHLPSPGAMNNVFAVYDAVRETTSDTSVSRDQKQIGKTLHSLCRRSLRGGAEVSAVR